MSESGPRTYIVTGAAGGIGGATVKRLLSTGANVLGVDISQRRLDILSESVATLGGHLATLRSDNGNEAIAEATIAFCLDRFGALHGVANVAGGMVQMQSDSMDRPISKMSLEYFRRTFALNLDTVFVLSKAAEPHFRAQGYGKIVNVASLAAFANRPEQGDLAYSAAKAAVIAFTQSMSVLLGRSGIRANCIAPGLVHSDHARDKLDGGFTERHIAITALGRLATVQDQAEAIAFLLEPASDAISGEVLRVAAGAR